MKYQMNRLILLISFSGFLVAQNHALYFGGNSYVDGGNVGAVVGDELTIELWINPELPGEWIGTFIHKGHESSTNYQLNLLRDTRQVQFRFHGDNNAWNGWKSSNATGLIQYSWQATGPNFSWDDWMHLAIVFQFGSPAEIYIDGEELGFYREAGINEAHLVNYDHNLYLGQPNIYAGEQRAFKGCMDEIRIWDRALDQGEIDDRRTRELDLNDPDDTDGLKAYYRFNDLELFNAYKVIDLVSGNEGVIHGATLCDGPPEIVQEVNGPPEDPGEHDAGHQPSFEDVDANGDGVIDREEARNFFGDDPDFDAQFDEIAGEDGVIVPAEFEPADEEEGKGD